MSEGREMLLRTNEELLPLWKEFTTGLLIIKVSQLNLPMILSSLPPPSPNTQNIKGGKIRDLTRTHYLILFRK